MGTFTELLSFPKPNADIRVPDDRDELLRLLEKYLDVLSDSDSEPTISFIGFAHLIKSYFIWALCLYVAIPIFALINPFIFLLNRVTGRKIEYRGREVFAIVARPFRSLHDGEIPALKFLTLGYVTKLFVSYHIAQRLDALSSALKSIELRESMRRKDIGTRAEICNRLELMAKFRGTLFKGLELKFVLLLAPYLPVLIKFVTPANSKILASHLYIWLRGYNSFLVRALPLLAYTLWVFVSSFIRKRELMNNRGIYAEEDRVFQLLHTMRTREFPVDLVGWQVFIVLATIPTLLHFYEFRQQHSLARVQLGILANFLVNLILLLSLFVYALYRRRRIGNC